MSERRSVFLDVLGEQAAGLRPEVLEYVSGPPDPDGLGVGRGVFTVAGSRYGALLNVARPVVGARVLLTRRGRDVPFEIVNRPRTLSSGTRVLDACRTFRFAGGSQSFTDRLEPGPRTGTLSNLLGSAGRVELTLAAEANTRGNLVMRSLGMHLRLGALRVRVPRLLGVQVAVEDGYDPVRRRRTIDATVRNPILGSILEYRGWFQYAYES